VAQHNVIATRAWIPWDSVSHQFRIDAPRIFPLSTTLYDHDRFMVATTQGTLAEAGPQRVVLGDLLLRALSFKPTQSVEGGQHEASILYSNLWLPPGGQIVGWFALHPRYFLHAAAGPISLQITVRADDGQSVTWAGNLDPMDKDHQSYQPVKLDLAAGQFGQRGSLEIRVLTPSAATEAPEVFIAEPRIVQP
jgi:hypothetical protein